MEPHEVENRLMTEQLLGACMPLPSDKAVANLHEQLLKICFGAIAGLVCSLSPSQAAQP